MKFLKIKTSNKDFSVEKLTDDDLKKSNDVIAIKTYY